MAERIPELNVFMKNSNPLEKDIEAAVCKHARELGMLEYKFASPARRHVPDRIFLYAGKIFFIEFKRLGEPPTKAQAIEHAKMRERGAMVFVVDNVRAGKEIINYVAGK